MMKRLSFSLLLFTMLFSAVGVFAFPTNSFAAPEPACRCYCDSKTEGVVGPYKNNTQASCVALCEKANRKKVVCATEYSQEPGANLSCFTKEQCTSQKGILDKKQPPECIKGSKYCYPDPAKQEKLKLQLSIGGLSETSNLGEYVNSFYQWMLNAGVIIAIVFVMIGGLQYVLAAGGGSVDAAKTRIRNAIVGLVLLFFSYLILFTVNPYLVRLKVPQLPMVKKVVLSKGGSCEVLKAQGFKIDPQKGKAADTGNQGCGDTGDVVGGPAGASVSEGLTCAYRTGCTSGSDQHCIGVGEKAECIDCQYFTEKNNYKNGLKPSSSNCELLSGAATGSGATLKQRRCGWTKDSDFQGGLGGLVKALDQGSCAVIQLNCANVKKCEDYGDVPVFNKSEGSGTLKDIVDSNDSLLDKGACAGSCGDFSLQSYCNENPCAVATGCSVHEKKCMSPDGIAKKKAHDAALQKAQLEAFKYPTGGKF